MKQVVVVQDTEISISKVNGEEYISLTDMLKAKDGDFFISDWLRNRNTIEFLGIWEKVNNPNFNYGEFAIIKSQVGLNSYKISAKEWTKHTNAIGLIAKPGRYGGTFAHKDIALEFGMWISAEFKIYLIKEFQRLKEQETTDWSLRRHLSKINYRLHSEAVQTHLIPKSLNSSQISMVYATEADVLNVALFGKTAAQWRENDDSINGNMRDQATLTQLVCLSNLENLNSVLIHEGLSQTERLKKLNQIAIHQMSVLSKEEPLFPDHL